MTKFLPGNKTKLVCVDYPHGIFMSIFIPWKILPSSLVLLPFPPSPWNHSLCLFAIPFTLDLFVTHHFSVRSHIRNQTTSKNHFQNTNYQRVKSITVPWHMGHYSNWSLKDYFIQIHHWIFIFVSNKVTTYFNAYMAI